MAIPTDMNSIVAGVAALSICESLLLAMGDLKIMDETEVIGVIADAASAHRGVGENHQDVALNNSVVVLLERIIAGGNSVRRA
ncbi:MAG: hypothetical protein APF80_12280 [Alphaproteobacteria bacterium BRH_c36]|nr:MAG: hypothetical protein APF80_12280 [Alphaproteobacteria bacterium BRH_c36]